MRPEIRLWSIEKDKLVELNKGSFADVYKEKDIEAWIEHNPSALGRNLVIIGRQIYLAKVGIIDLLATDENGRLVIVEFKRQQSTRDTVAQILDYASSIRLLTVEQIRGLNNVDGTKLAGPTDADPAMIIVAAEVDQSIDRIVDYLASKTGLPIEVVTFTYATTSDGKEIIARSILAPEPIPGSTISKNAAKITLAELYSIAEERNVLSIVQALHQVVDIGWFVEMFRNNGGQIRYWVKLASGSWRVLFGIYIGGEKFNSPNGQLDVWIRPEVVAEFIGSTLDQVQSELKQFTVHHETQTATIVRIGDIGAASKLLGLLQHWDSLITAANLKTVDSET